MPDGHRRSRTGWADAMEAGPPHPPAHTHRLPPLVRAAIIGLTLAMLLSLVAIGLMATAVYQANQYVQGRGEYRDREAARMEAESTERTRRAMCDLLDTLPEGGLLDRPGGPRDKYDCGPGIPFDQLTPQEQAQLQGQAHTAPQTQAAPSGAEFAPDGFDYAAGASPDVPPTEPYYPTPGVAEPDPTVPIPDGFPPPDPVQPTAPPLEPATETVCAVIGLCF